MKVWVLELRKLHAWLAALWLIGLPVMVAADPLPAPDYDRQLLNVDLKDIEPADVTSGFLDAQFKSYQPEDVQRAGRVLWLKFIARTDFHPHDTPALLLRKSRDNDVRLFTLDNGKQTELIPVTQISQFGASHQLVYLAPEGINHGQAWYVRIERPLNEPDGVRLSNDTVQAALARNDAHAQIIDLVFGALMALSLSVVLIWLVLKDSLLIHYSLLILMQALYIAYFSGQAFDWPLFRYALPLEAYTWNVPIALSGAFACLFVRGITDMKHFSVLAYRIFGWLAISFTVLAVTNVVQNFGLALFIARVGNACF